VISFFVCVDLLKVENTIASMPTDVSFIFAVDSF